MNTPIYYGGIGILHALPRHRPARLSLLVGRVLATPRALFQRLSDWQEKSRKLRQLDRLDDHALADIGLSRAEAFNELTRRYWRK